MRFRERQVVQYLYVLTLGFSRRSLFCASTNERLSRFLEVHERVFEHFGGNTCEHLYDCPRTVCHPTENGRVKWNTTFKVSPGSGCPQLQPARCDGPMPAVSHHRS